MNESGRPAPQGKSIAIIGVAGRFPGARSVPEFWQNQLNGVESIQAFTGEEKQAGNGNESGATFVAARGVVERADLFDADFFGVHPREAALMDPQHRIFLECCWEALEDAGYVPGNAEEAGVFAGCAMPTYFLSTLCADPQFVKEFTRGYQVENYSEMLGNSLDFLSTRVSYKLDLRGPSFTLQAGCSTSLLAVCQACESLRSGGCEMALAGGVSVTFPQARAARYQEGGMISPDGHCRAFDAAASGTVFGSGAGVVLLKQLEKALRDGDHIYAVIRGFAVNNDGSAKAGYTAPSIEGQIRVIEAAQRDAGVAPWEIGYVEAHGTGTPLGDPIELAALDQCFRKRSSAKQFCVLGTVKTNIGHLDVAAGITGLIHAMQIVRDGEFPPTLHFAEPNRHFRLAESAFLVNRERRQWPASECRRKAGVSSFGVGGTNAHVILEEAPHRQASVSGRPASLLVTSARSESALKKAVANLAAHLQVHPEANLQDVAFTLQVGRKAFAYRRAIVARDAAEACASLRAEPKRADTGQAPNQQPSVVFLFPGQGSQQPSMALDLYNIESTFREAVDQCCELLRPHLGCGLRELLCKIGGASADPTIHRTEFAQPAIFVFEYALAQLWMSWGIRPSAVLGHSAGEFVAATVAGVLTLRDAAMLIATRGKLIQGLPGGAMLAVRVPEAKLREILPAGLSLAAINSPSTCVVSGPLSAIQAFERELAEQGIGTRRLTTSHAFHSSMMEPALGPLGERLRSIRMGSPAIPYVSSLTGNWIRETDLSDSQYWVRHLREPVRLSDGLWLLLREANRIFLEVGPGKALSSSVREHRKPGFPLPKSVASLPEVSPQRKAYESLLSALGSLWLAGAQPDWQALYSGERRFRVPLPTYPFERKRFWIDTAEAKDSSAREEICSQEEPATMNALGSSAGAADSNSRVESLRSALTQMFAELSGTSLTSEDAATGFLELGFDSLFLTQVSIALQSRFGVKISFRQLLSEFPTVDALARRLDAILPAGEQRKEQIAPLDSTAAERTDPPVAPSDRLRIAASEYSDELQSFLRDQTRAMSDLFAKQMEVLRERPFKRGASAEPKRSVLSSLQAAPGLIEGRGSAQPGKNSSRSTAFAPFRPPETGGSGELNASQRQYLSRLIERCTARTPRSKALTQEHRSVLADPRVVSGFRPEWKEMGYPIVAVRSEGASLWDVDGNEYVDLLSGFGSILLGHRPGFIVRALEERIHEGFEIGPQSHLAGEVAELFCEMTGNERMTFCNTGSEAVMAALRVARTVTGRNKVALFSGSYHGMFDEVLVKRSNRDQASGAFPIAPGIPKENLGNIAVLEYGSDAALDWIHENASSLAAILVEPVQSRHPALQPAGFLREVRRITENSGTALIFDEVVTGFRVHPGGCQALFGIRADLVTYGKVLAGGMPIGVLAGRAQFMDALDGGVWQFGDDSAPQAGVTFFAGTFVRHPLALAAARATLLHLKAEGPALRERLARNTTEFTNTIRSLIERHHAPAALEHFSSLFYVHFPREFPLGSLLFYALREKGVYLLEGFPCFLGTAHGRDELRRAQDAFAEAISEMDDADVFASEKRERISAQPKPPSASVSLQDETTRPAPAEVPLTQGQWEILLAAQMSDKASCAFNESFTLRMTGQLDRGALEHALDQLFRRHDALRASLSPEHTTLRFAPYVAAPLRFEDISELGPTQARATLTAAIQADAATPFDLSHPPLARCSLFRMGESEHVLLFTAHHLICDGWSTNVLLSELGKLYSSRTSGTDGLLAAAPQFSEYAMARSKYGRNGHSDAATREYWVKRFRDLPPLLELPTDRPRPAVKSFAGATVRAQMDRRELQALQRAAARHRGTLFSCLLTAFGALLYRLTSQQDIVIGIPFAGQSVLFNSDLVGHCVNFLPIRTKWRDDERAADALQRIQQSIVEAHEHHDYTYGTLVRDLNMRREPGRLPLVEVQFNLEKLGGDFSLRGLRTQIEANPKAAVNFDFFLNAVETPDGLVLDCDYNSDLFDQSTVARWLSHYCELLRSFATHPETVVGDLPLLTDCERSRLIQEWNATSREFDLDTRVHRLFERQAARTPTAIAVSAGGTALTYRELDQRANRLARHLRKIGLDSPDLVGIALDRSVEMLVALLAVWKAGAAYVPLDPAYPQERLSFILQDAAIPILVTTSELVDRLPLCEARLVCVDRDAVLIAQEEADVPEFASASTHRAYVIYTSGSTGQPKGVAVTQRNLVNLLLSMQAEPGIAPEDRLLAVTTLSFDIAALELFLPVITGARVVLADRDAAADGRALRRLVQTEGITVMQATPATWRLLLEAGWPEGHRLKMLCGGEALSRDLADALLPHGELWNMYGPTETTVWSAASRVQAGSGLVPLGQPIANTQFYILDSKQQLLPIGVAGELCIGGEGVAEGYFHRPELTEKSFLPDPFHPGMNRRIYRTGDTVRRLADGTLEFLGRSDQQVKIRGFRVELQEVESVLHQHPAVRQAVAAGCDDEHGFKRLVAYIVPSGPARPDPSDLRQWLSARLPSYMVPSFFVFLDALPQTPNGKVDRKTLPVLDQPPRQSEEFVAPRTDLEVTLAAICADVLHLDRISVSASLFDLGADSLHIFQIVSRAAQAGTIISAGQVTRLQNIAAVAREAEKMTGAASSSSLPPLVPALREGFRVASSAN